MLLYQPSRKMHTHCNKFIKRDKNTVQCKIVKNYTSKNSLYLLKVAKQCKKLRKLISILRCECPTYNSEQKLAGCLMFPY